MVDLTLHQDQRTYTSRVSIPVAMELIKALPAGTFYRVCWAGTQWELWL